MAPTTPPFRPCSKFYSPTIKTEAPHTDCHPKLSRCQYSRLSLSTYWNEIRLDSCNATSIAVQTGPKGVKERCFNTFVRPTLEYRCSVWDPHKITQVDNLEKINKRAARFVTGNYTLAPGNTQKNMSSLNWAPLSERRARAKLITLFKAKSGIIELPLDDLKCRNSSTRSHKHNYFIPPSSVDSHLYSFFPNTIRLWNKLP